jgi:hypothetical protein
VKFEVTFTGSLIWEPGPGESLEQRDPEFETVFAVTMEELIALAVEDPSVTGSIATGTMEISLLVDAADPAIAIEIANGTIRSALHCAGVFTPSWEYSAPTRIAVTWHKVEADEPVAA